MSGGVLEGSLFESLVAFSDELRLRMNALFLCLLDLSLSLELELITFC